MPGIKRECIVKYFKENEMIILERYVHGSYNICKLCPCFEFYIYIYMQFANNGGW